MFWCKLQDCILYSANSKIVYCIVLFWNSTQTVLCWISEHCDFLPPTVLSWACSSVMLICVISYMTWFFHLYLGRPPCSCAVRYYPYGQYQSEVMRKGKCIILQFVEWRNVCICHKMWLKITRIELQENQKQHERVSCIRREVLATVRRVLKPQSPVVHSNKLVQSQE